VLSLTGNEHEVLNHSAILITVEIHLPKPVEVEATPLITSADCLVVHHFWIRLYLFNPDLTAALATARLYP